MAVHSEHAESPAVVRVVEMVGVSSKSWSDAAKQVVARASETIRHYHRRRCGAQHRRGP
jgi:flavin-binding protein dodecin